MQQTKTRHYALFINLSKCPCISFGCRTPSRFSLNQGLELTTPHMLGNSS